MYTILLPEIMFKGEIIWRVKNFFGQGDLRDFLMIKLNLTSVN